MSAKIKDYSSKSSTKGVYFNGKLVTIPGVYSSVDSTMTNSKNSDSTKIIAIVGQSTGGEPDTVQFFSEPAVAKKILKSGELLQACIKAWNPVTKTKEGVDLGGANYIACIRSNMASKSTSVVKAGANTDGKVNVISKSVSVETTGDIEVTGDFTGNVNETYLITVTSAGEQLIDTTTEPDHPVFNVQFNYKLATDADFRLGKDVTAGAEPTPLSDSGLHIKFKDGKYHNGDTFYVECVKAVGADDAFYTVTSSDWGADTAKIQHKLSDGSTEGTKKLTVYDFKNDNYEIFDNLGAMFSIMYTGTQPYAVLNIISDGEENSIRLQTKIGASKDKAIVDLDIELDANIYKSVKSLASTLSSYENYEIVVNSKVNNFVSVNMMDFVAEQDIKKKFTVTAVLSDMKLTLARKSQLVEMEISNKHIGIPANYDYKALTGGSEGQIPTSWEHYFDMLGRFNISYIVPLTEDISIMAECAEHCKKMSEEMGKERRMVCGSSTGLDVRDALDVAATFDSDRVQYVYPAIYDKNEDGDTVLYPAYILAAQHAGRAAHLPDGESATHDVYNVAGVEKELDPEEVKTLLNGGVVPFEFTIPEDSFSSSIIRCVQDITTYTDDNNSLYTERAIGATADNLSKEIRSAIDDMLTGKRTTPAILTSVKNKVLSILKDKVKNDVILDYKDVQVYKSNGAVWVNYSVAPSEPTNFTFVQGHFYSMDISAE